jgi:hypothetical protein
VFASEGSLIQNLPHYKRKTRNVDETLRAQVLQILSSGKSGFWLLRQRDFTQWWINPDHMRNLTLLALQVVRFADLILINDKGIFWLTVAQPLSNTAATATTVNTVFFIMLLSPAVRFSLTIANACPRSPAYFCDT